MVAHGTESARSCGFASTTSLVLRRPRLLNRCRPRACVAPPPGNYAALQEEAIESIQRALRSGVQLVEVQFPPVANMATAALNELLDANRGYASTFARALAPRYSANRVDVVFPDIGEAKLAKKAWGETPFGVRALPKKGFGGPTPNYVSGEGDGLVVVVSPGFNVSEWICMEALECEGGDPIVLVNGDLDKVRGSYYPRLFYPGLHKVRDRFLSRFEEVYYLKMFSNGGTLMRRFGEDWTLLYSSVDGSASRTLMSYPERPAFRDVEDELRRARTEELVSKR